MHLGLGKIGQEMGRATRNAHNEWYTSEKFLRCHRKQGKKATVFWFKK
jgi:hypothetical protein